MARYLVHPGPISVLGLGLAAWLTIFASPASACSGTDDCANGLVFKHYASQGPATETMAVFLHGDVSRGGSSDYMLSSAQRFVKDVPGAHAVVLIRPGYFDRDKRMSEGSDCNRRDCYTEDVVAIVAGAVAELKERFGAKTVLGFGHSGGSAILATLLARRPRLMAGAVLTSCPCDIRSWKPGWTRSISPLDTVREVSNTAKIIAVTGRDDDNTAPAIAQRYVGALKSAGKDAVFMPTEGTHDYRSVRNAGLEALQGLTGR